VPFLDFLSFKNDVNVPSKSNMQKNFNKTCWRLEGQWRKQQDPDPLVRGMYPRIRIHTKMSWIRNTAANSDKDPDPLWSGSLDPDPVRIEFKSGIWIPLKPILIRNTD
jgi:hypothetical protein